MMEKWLNGWPRSGATVIIGGEVHCSGCGKSFGLTCFVIDPTIQTPDKTPDWPFSKHDCPVCSRSAGKKLTPEEIAKQPIGDIRRAIEILKTRNATK